MKPMTAPTSGLPCRGYARATRTNVAKLALAIRTALGIELVDGTTRHGHISTIRKPPGQPFFAVEGYTEDEGGARVPFRRDVDACPCCAVAVPRASGHECCEIVLYDAPEPANDEHPGIALRAHGLSVTQLAQLRTVLDGHVPGAA